MTPERMVQDALTIMHTHLDQQQADFRLLMAVVFALIVGSVVLAVVAARLHQRVKWLERIIENLPFASDGPSVPGSWRLERTPERMAAQ